MNDQELSVLASLRGPSAQLKMDAEKYITDATYRKHVDEADKQNGTTIGRKLRAIYFEGREPGPAPQPAPEPSPIDVLEATRKYPKERCIELFKRSANVPGQSSSNLSPEEYKTAKLAAVHFGVLPSDGPRAEVRYNYETSRDRRVKREAEEKRAAEAQRNFTPPGITRAEGGELLLTDSAAFERWKQERAAERELEKVS